MCSIKLHRQGRAVGRLSWWALPLGAIATAWAGPSVYPKGVTRYDPLKAYHCDFLFTAPNEKTYLIGMKGNVLHEWDKGGFPAKMLDPKLTDGIRGIIGVQTAHVRAGSHAGAVYRLRGFNVTYADLTFGYVNWQGKTLWKWGTQAPGGAALQHHDWEKLANGDTLILGARVDQPRALGGRLVFDPVIYDVNEAGHLVWSWRASQHLKGLGFSGAKLKLLAHGTDPDYLQMNDMRTLGPNRWAASGDRRFAPNNILVSSRTGNFLAIISRKTGHVVWRMGPTFARRKSGLFWALGKRPPFKVDGFSGQHDAHLIPEGLPGAGDLLVLDDEGEGGYPPADLPVLSGSRVLEINPVTRTVVWEYAGTKRTFFTPFEGSVQRLPNGNTLIDEAIWGRFFQVTPAGKIVWEYVSPYVRKGPAHLEGFPRYVPWTYRVQAVPYSWVPDKARQ